MDTSYQGFRAYYARLADHDLREAALTASHLIEDAQRALAEELEKRGITRADTTAYRAEMLAHADAHKAYLEQRRAAIERGHRIWRRVIFAVFGFPFLFGAWRFFVKGDSSGVVIMLICALMLPAVLLWAYAKTRLIQALLVSPSNNRWRGP